MWDRQTESWWQQLTGEGIVGVYAGYRLNLVPAQIVSWGDFKDAFPDADVLSRETGHNRDYGRNPYYGYDRVDQSPFLFRGVPTTACCRWNGWPRWSWTDSRWHSPL